MKVQSRPLFFYIYAILSHFILIMIVQVECDWLIKCGKCKCKWNSGKKTADCRNSTLTKIPIDLSSEVQVLDMSYNYIKRIEENAFKISDLQNLHKLFMRNCSIEQIKSVGLKGLEILIEIDLSSNLLKFLQRDSFINLVKVRAIILNQNLLETLENGVFRNLKYLHKIELKENRIKHVNADVFINLPNLSQIFLNDNHLTFLRKETFEKLKRLASLSLESNPWNCTCELQIFRDFALKRNLYTPPTSCYYPSNLRSVLWNDENSGAFACKPKIIYPSRGASINTSKENVTLICRVHASPNTVIAWDYNKQIYSNINYQARVHIQLLREDANSEPISNSHGNRIEKEIGRDIFISRLTIIGAEKSDEGIYTCLAENPGGKDEVQMSLLVQKHNAQDLFIQNNIVIIIFLMVLGLLSASIFLVLVTCFIYRKIKITVAHQHQQEQQTNENHQLHNHHRSHSGNGGSDNMTSTSEDSIELQKSNNNQHLITELTNVNVNETTISNQRSGHKYSNGAVVKSSTQLKLPNGNGHLIGNIKNFDGNENESELYHENNTQDSQHQQKLRNHRQSSGNDKRNKCIPSNTAFNAAQLASSVNKTTLMHSKKLEHQPNENHIHQTVNKNKDEQDYQPDLLPYKQPQQTFNNTINNSLINVCGDDEENDSKQHRQQLHTNQNPLQFHDRSSNSDDDEIDLHIPKLTTTKPAVTVATKLQPTILNEIYQRNDQIGNIHRYTANLASKNYNSSGSVSNKFITDQTSEYLLTSSYIDPTFLASSLFPARENCISHQQQPVSLPMTYSSNGNLSNKLLQQYYHQLQNDSRQLSNQNSVISSSLHQLCSQNDAGDNNKDDIRNILYQDKDIVGNISSIDGVSERYELDNNQHLPRRQSIVTTSPSLNFLTTNYPRRQLL